MRGKLIHPQLAEIFQLDTVLTAADTDGAGPLTSGYDPFLREPIKAQAASGEGPGVTQRKEKSTLRVKCQVEISTYDRLRPTFQGNDPDADLAVVFHFKDLEKAGLVDAHGEPAFRIGDRLNAFYTWRPVKLIWTLRPSLFVKEVQPQSLGLTSRTRNLLVVTFGSRQQGISP
jgi:hypothetical protein